MKIQVSITTWSVPFDQVVESVSTFGSADDALKFINAASLKWWQTIEGDRSVTEMGGDAYEPVTELGYQQARYEVWGGEQGWHAMLDRASYSQLHEAHYAREYDAKGKPRPGYLRNAYAAGMKP